MDADTWHAEERQRYALTLAELLDAEPLLAEAGATQDPTKLLRCPNGHPLFSVTPGHDGHGRVVLKVREHLDYRLLQPTFPGARPRGPIDGAPAELEPKVELTCRAPGCRFRRAFQRSDLLRLYAHHLYRRGDIILPP